MKYLLDEQHCSATVADAVSLVGLFHNEVTNGFYKTLNLVRVSMMCGACQLSAKCNLNRLFLKWMPIYSYVITAWQAFTVIDA